MTISTLVLFRHAKAEPPERYATDTERPLSARGRRDAADAGRWLVERGFVPDLVLCSPSVRTRETWLAAADALESESPTVRFEPLLYSGGLRTAEQLIAEVDPSAATVLVIGHNPTLSMLSAMYDPGGASPTGLRTAGLAVHCLAGPWSAYSQGSAPVIATYTARG